MEGAFYCNELAHNKKRPVLLNKDGALFIILF